MKTITSSRVNLPVILILCCVCALILNSAVSSKGPGSLETDKIKASVRMFDVGLGPHTIKVQMGRDTESLYLGDSPLQQALQTGQAQPRTMVGEDFNGDGMGDLIIGYANNGSGILSFRMGNVQAIAPTGEVFEGVQQGRYPAPFLPEARLYSLPEAPDFLQVGDFNADGYEDVLAAARGGATLYLLAGDGRGNLGAVQEFQLSGSLTALQANESRQPGVFTSLALGLRTDQGTKAVIYNHAGGGFAGEPESYSMPGDVTAFAFGRLDDDVELDLAAATANQVLVIHGRSDQPTDPGKGALTVSAYKTAAVETESLPFVIRGLAVGDFVWDRNHEREIAVLSDDGTVYLSARGNPDTRPLTDQEKITLRDLKRSYTLSKIDMETFRAESNKLVRPNLDGSWKVAQTIKSGVTPAAIGSTPSLFQRLDASTLPTDDLLIGNAMNNRLQMTRNDHDAAKLKIKATTRTVDLDQLSTDGAPIAAVSMRMNIDSRPGSVVLKEGKVEPELVILSPDATFNVNSFSDLADDVPTSANGVCHTTANNCTLRAAIMQSNHTGGSNAITVPDGTYTLSLGTPDDETHTGGATEQSGDLDIFNWNAFDGSPVLTAVSITGGTRDGCIVQVGNFTAYVPQSGVAVPNNKERILEVNDGATIQSKINVTLTNLTFQNGVTPTNDGTFLDGGGIRYDGSDANALTNVGLLTLHNVKVSNNTSPGFGGGVLGAFGSMKIESTSIIRANSATNKVGGGVEYNGGNTTNETQFFSVDGSTIGGTLVADGNQATDATFGAGGGIDTRGGGLNGIGIVISGGTLIQNNIAHSVNGSNGGGGMQIDNGPFFALSNSTITNNSAKNNGGGLRNNAVLLSGGNAAVTLTSMTITGNIADSEGNGVGDGGGIQNFCGSLVITGTSHIDSNTAVNGGGIFNTWNGINAPAAGLTMTNGTIGQSGAGNNAKNNGGGVAINPGAPPTPGTINLNTVSIGFNTANSDSSGGGDGGGIFVATGNLSSLNGSTIDSNVANSGTGDGIRQTGGTITGAGTLNVNGGDSISLSGGTFTSTSGTLNLTGNLLNSGGNFVHNSGTVVCNGSTGAQTIGGSTATTFFNLTINNSSGVNWGGSGTVAGTLNLTSGVLGVGANTLTLNGPVSFTSGSISSSATGTVNYNQSAANQNVAPGIYGNLTFSNFVKVLPNGSTVSIAGTFTPGSTQPTNTGSTVVFNGATTQTVPPLNYNNLTISGNRGGGTVTLGAGTIGVAGVFNPSATNVVYAITGNTFDFNGAGAQTVPTFDFNSLTISNTHGANAVTLVNGGTIGIAGTFTPGSSTFVTTGNTVNFNGAGTQTIPAFNFNNLTVSNTHGANAVTLVNGGTIGVAGVFTPGTSTFTVTGNTVDFNGAGAQTVPAFNFNNLNISNTHGANPVTLVNGGTIGVAGTFTPGASTFVITGNTMNFNGAAAQSIPQFNFNSLTISGVRTINTSVTLVSGGTIGIAGTFSPTATFSGTGAYIVANNTVNFNGTGAQTIAAPFNYNNLTISLDRGGAAVTLGSGNIGVAGALVLSATNNTWVNTGNTIIFNGAAPQTVPAFAFFNGLTLNNSTGGTLAGNVTVGGALTLTLGTLAVGTNTLTLNGAVSAPGGTLSSAPTGTVNYNQQSNGQATVLAANYGNLTFSNFSKTLAGSGTIGIASTFTPGTGVGHTITGSTINFNGAGSQNIPGFTYNNLTSSGGGVARVLDPVNTIKIAGAFTPGSDLYTIAGSTLEYNGGAAQSLPVTFLTYNNVTFNNPTTVTGGPATMDVNGNLQITQGTFAAGGALSITVGGNWTNNGGAFSPSTGDVTFDGGAGQAIGGTTATTFNNLSVGNASGLAMNNDNTVNAVLALVGSDITVAATKTLTQPVGGTSSGAFDVNGRVQRTGFVNGGAALSFGNPFNSIKVTAGVAPANIVVDLVRAVPSGAQGYPTAVQRTYTITPSAAGFTGTLRLHYKTGELNGNDPTLLNLWRFDSGISAWRPNPATARDCAAGCTTNNSNFWVERAGVTTFSPWTLNSTNAPTASGSTVTGRITDNHGLPVEGAVVRLQGTQNRKFITDANGFYRFDNVETSGFYTITPSRVNYTFSPASRSFSQLGDSTEATFGATLASSNPENPLDTPEYFVRQHYLDFLGREPDEAGFNFWSDQILSCGNDNECIDRKRENVSAAYFLSIEFQQTGGLVDGMYRASYGAAPQYAAFLPDVRQVGAGVIVGTDNWQAKLAANTEAFVNDFANRAAFHQMYDSMDNTLFVDTLIQHTGVSFTAAERDALVTGLGTGTLTRGEALRSIAENQSFVTAKFNQAFVMMEYFGYLRRDPDSGGYGFWLNKLNEFGGNFEQAEMVKAFIVSGEYRDRFPR